MNGPTGTEGPGAGGTPGHGRGPRSPCSPRQGRTTSETEEPPGDQGVLRGGSDRRRSGDLTIFSDSEGAISLFLCARRGPDQEFRRMVIVGLSWLPGRKWPRYGPAHRPTTQPCDRNGVAVRGPTRFTECGARAAGLRTSARRGPIQSGLNRGVQHRACGIEHCILKDEPDLGGPNTSAVPTLISARPLARRLRTPAAWTVLWVLLLGVVLTHTVTPGLSRLTARICSLEPARPGGGPVGREAPLTALVRIRRRASNGALEELRLRFPNSWLMVTASGLAPGSGPCHPSAR